MNQINLLGRLTKDPEMRYTENGTAVTRFTLAVARENTDKTDFIHCITFGKVAENTAQYCNKGRQVLLSGRLEINTRTNQETNQMESFTTVVAVRIDFLAKPRLESNPQQVNNHQYGQNQQQNPQQQDNYSQNTQYQQQRFQPTTNGWQNPSDTDLPY